MSTWREIETFAPLRRISSFYRTEPVGFRDQPDFWNAVVEIAWSGTPSELLRRTREVERRLAGYPHVRNYLGSWGEWGNRDDAPIDRPRRRTPRS